MVAMLQSPVLVLNKGFCPVNSTNAGEALSMVFRDVAHVIDVESVPVQGSDRFEIVGTYEPYGWGDWSALDSEDRFIQFPGYRVRVPEIIRTTDFNQLPSSVVTYSRKNLMQRDNCICQYCLERFPTEELTIDHVVPRAQGGTSCFENAVAACVNCNSRKANRTPEQAGMPLRNQPVRPPWTPKYASQIGRWASWDQFLPQDKKGLSEAYWNVELEP